MIDSNSTTSQNTLSYSMSLTVYELTTEIGEDFGRFRIQVGVFTDLAIFLAGVRFRRPDRQL